MKSPIKQIKIDILLATKFAVDSSGVGGGIVQLCSCKRARNRVALQLLHTVSKYDFDPRDDALMRSKLVGFDEEVWLMMIGDDLLEDGFDAARYGGGSPNGATMGGMTGVVAR